MYGPSVLNDIFSIFTWYDQIVSALFLLVRNILLNDQIAILMIRVLEIAIPVILWKLVLGDIFRSIFLDGSGENKKWNKSVVVLVGLVVILLFATRYK